MFSPQSYTNMIDINLCPVCDNKETIWNTADVSFQPSAVSRFSLSVSLATSFCLWLAAG